MSFARCIDTAVVIPARDEAKRIASCLAALAPQTSERVQIILVVNNTRDATGQIAQDIACRLNVNLQVMNVTYPSNLGVGEARRLGAEFALRTLPHLRHVLTTDADCRAAPNWIERSIFHLKAVDAVCGKVALHPGEAACLEGLDPRLQVYEDAYRELVQDAFARYAPNCTDLRGSHGQTPGASLGFTSEAYLAAGGFSPIPCGEDRQIMRALRTQNMRVRHASDVCVEASCRLTGRAAGGMADTLRARLEGGNYSTDDCLPRAEDLTRQIRQGQLPCWPPKVAVDDCIPVRELPQHIARLRKALATPLLSQAIALPPHGPAQVPTASGQQAIYAAPTRG